MAKEKISEAHPIFEASFIILKDILQVYIWFLFDNSSMTSPFWTKNPLFLPSSSPADNNKIIWQVNIKIWQVDITIWKDNIIPDKST